jgi:hypothetical protein
MDSRPTRAKDLAKRRPRHLHGVVINLGLQTVTISNDTVKMDSIHRTAVFKLHGPTQLPGTFF